MYEIKCAMGLRTHHSCDEANHQVAIGTEVSVYRLSTPSSRHDLRLSGTSGLISITALSKSSTTLLPLPLPVFLISAIFASVSLAASSSIFLLPLECCASHQSAAVCMVGLLEWKRRTSFSKALNSSSFCSRYSSISFWASDLASFTRFVRSGDGQRVVGKESALSRRDVHSRAGRRLVCDLQ
jgi:hypothetical protein